MLVPTKFLIWKGCSVCAVVIAEGEMETIPAHSAVTLRSQVVHEASGKGAIR